MPGELSIDRGDLGTGEKMAQQLSGKIQVQFPGHMAANNSL